MLAQLRGDLTYDGLGIALGELKLAYQDAGKVSYIDDLQERPEVVAEVFFEVLKERRRAG